MVAEVDYAGDGIGVRDLLEAGLHFGHQTKRWNPKMKRYIFDKRNGIHIIDLSKSLVQLQEALQFLHDTASAGRPILFVGTKKQAQQIVKDTAENSGQFYVSHRWLGGTLTNSATIQRSIKRMRDLEAMLNDPDSKPSNKKELARYNREHAKLQRNLGGIAGMAKLPGALFVVDINREAIAVKEANRLGIPVVAIVDTNCDPDPIDYVIPGNDDAIRAINLICRTATDAVKNGWNEYQKREAEKAAAEARKAKEAEEAAQAAAAETAARKADDGGATGVEPAPAPETAATTASTNTTEKQPAAPAEKTEG